MRWCRFHSLSPFFIIFAILLIPEKPIRISLCSPIPHSSNHCQCFIDPCSICLLILFDLNEILHEYLNIILQPIFRILLFLSLPHNELLELNVRINFRYAISNMIHIVIWVKILSIVPLTHWINILSINHLSIMVKSQFSSWLSNLLRVNFGRCI